MVVFLYNYIFYIYYLFRIWLLKFKKAVLLCLGFIVWTNPGFSVSVSQNHQMDRSQIKTNTSVCSKSSAATSNHSTQGKNASSSQIPTVCFDLGDEWDDWGDFDDENLVHASETSAVSCTTNHKPQVRQSADSKLGAVNHLFIPCETVWIKNVSHIL